MRPHDYLRLLVTCGCLLIIVAMITVMMAPIIAISVIGVAMVKGEGAIYEWYNGPFAQWLGLGCATGFTLSAADMEKISSLGIPINAVSAAEAGRQWCGSKYGGNIDIGIVLAIMNMESDYGSNMGNSDWVQAINGNGNINHADEIAAGTWLLNYWKEHNVRSRSSEAAHHIYPNYGGYLGHSSAGEIGDGFLPTSAKRVCQVIMNESDPDLASCNLFSRKANGYAISWYLYRAGYSADQSFSEKVDSLYSWNHNYATRVALVTRAKAIDAVVDTIHIFTQVSSTILEPGKSLLGDFKLFLIAFLDSIDLLPERVGWLEMPLREEDLNTQFWEDGISQDYMETTYDSRGHPGIDFVCRTLGVDVIAVANGVVIEPDPNTVMGYLSITDKAHNYGNNVWIDHGGGLYALYAHLEEIDVEVGQTVTQGQVIGKCGSTGNSTGPHVHFQVLNIHPNEMTSYRQEDPGNVNPHDVLGTCFAIKKEEEE